MATLSISLFCNARPAKRPRTGKEILNETTLRAWIVGKLKVDADSKLPWTEMKRTVTQHFGQKVADNMLLACRLKKKKSNGNSARSASEPSGS